MNTNRKPREKCILKNLAPARQEALFTFMEGEGEEKGHSYRECMAWLADDGIKASKERLRRWRDWYYLRLGFRESRDDMRTLLESEAEDGETVPEERVQRMGNKMFAMRAIKNRDGAAWNMVQRGILENRRVNALTAKVTLDVTRFQFDASKACLAALPALREIESDNSLDQNAKVNAIREKLFGQLPKES